LKSQRDFPVGGAASKVFKSMTKKWFMITLSVVLVSLVMILRDRLPGPMGDVGFVLVEGLDSSLDWLRGVFSLRT
jgi:hypothetical protein